MNLIIVFYNNPLNILDVFSVETVPDYSKLTLTQAKRYEMDAQVPYTCCTLSPGELWFT